MSENQIYAKYTELSGTDNFKNRLEMLLPKNKDQIDRINAIIAKELKNNPKAFENCTAASVCFAVSELVQLNLEPGMHAHLVPFKNQCQLIINYKGYIELAWRTGKVKSLDVANVYEGDKFEYEMGTEAYIKHVPLLNQKNKIKLCTYAIIKYDKGGSQFVIIDNEQMEQYKKYSKSLYIFDSKTQSKILNPKSFWALHTEWMEKKTALKQLFKIVPMSIFSELHRAMESEDKSLEEKNIINVTETEIEKTNNDKLLETLNEYNAINIVENQSQVVA